MNLFIIILLFICVQSNNDTASEPNLMADTIKTLMHIVENPKLVAAIELLKSIRTETNKTIKEKYNQKGFLRTHDIYDYSYGSVIKYKLRLLVNLWLDDTQIAFLPTSYKNILKNAMSEFEMQIMDEPYHKHNYELSFNNGTGTLFMLILSLAPHPTLTNTVKWTKTFMWTEFEPASSYIIVTHTQCDLFSCNKTDEIVYLPTIMTD
jgi:hypothetical protein